MKRIKHALLTWLVNKVWNLVDPALVLRVEKDGVYLGKERLTEGQVANFRNEARILQELQLWKILTNTLQYEAERMMFTKATDFQHMVNGKMMLYTIDVQKKILGIFEKVAR